MSMSITNALQSTVFVAGLAHTTSSQDLHTAFRPVGQITGLRLGLSSQSRQCLGFAFVMMNDHNAAKTAVSRITTVAQNAVSLYLITPSPHNPPPGTHSSHALTHLEASSLARVALAHSRDPAAEAADLTQVLTYLAELALGQEGEAQFIPSGPPCANSVPAAAWDDFPRARALFERASLVPQLSSKTPLQFLNEYVIARNLKVELVDEPVEGAPYSATAAIRREKEAIEGVEPVGIDFTAQGSGPTKKAARQVAGVGLINALLEGGVEDSVFGVDASLAKFGLVAQGGSANIGDAQALAARQMASMLADYPKCKALLEAFHAQPGGTTKTPMSLLHEYAMRISAAVKSADLESSASGGFRSEVQLMSKEEEGEQVVASGVGEARTKQASRQAAAAAVIETLLETGITQAAFGLNLSGGSRSSGRGGRSGYGSYGRRGRGRGWRRGGSFRGRIRSEPPSGDEQAPLGHSTHSAPHPPGVVPPPPRGMKFTPKGRGEVMEGGYGQSDMLSGASSAGGVFQNFGPPGGLFSGILNYPDQGPMRQR